MQNPPPVQTSNPPPVQAASKSSTGLDENVAALLSYVVHFVSGLIFFLIEKNSRLVRFHAMQSLILGALFFLGGMVLIFVWSFITIIASQISVLFGSLMSLVVGLIMLVFFAAIVVGWIMVMVKAFQG